MIQFDHEASRIGSPTGAGSVSRNDIAPALVAPRAAGAAKGELTADGALAVTHRRLHRPLAQGQVHRPRRR